MKTSQERMITVIAEQFGIEERDVTPNKRIVEDLGGDSLDAVELMMALEDEFAIEIHDEDIADIRTVQQVFDYMTPRIRN